MENVSLLENISRLKAHIQEVLQERSMKASFFPKGVASSNGASAVLFLLSGNCPLDAANPNPCLVLNKRSQAVRQPGDLCFPGGGISPLLDQKLAKLMKFPFFPLSRWPYWQRWEKEKPEQARRLALLFATGIRECVEEMALNPLGVQFLGPLPPEHLVMFPREIFPFAGWIKGQKRFLTNREVEKIVHIPLGSLLNEDNYACYKLRFNMREGPMKNGAYGEFPCFRHNTTDGIDVLWGATYRMIMVFLDLIFGFRAPPMEHLKVVPGTIDEGYYGNRSHHRPNP